MTADLASAHVARLREYLGARYSHHTVSSFERSSTGFLRVAGAKPSYSREDVLRYLDALVRGGYKPESINAMIAGVRALFRALALPWPLDRADMHLGLPASEPGGVVLPASDVAAMISGADRLGYPDRQLVALAGTWGLRNQELGEVLSAGCQGKVLEVQTAKGGRRRVHAIPERLQGVLTFAGKAIGRDGTHDHFDTVVARCLQRRPAKGEGWHAVRRALVSGLVGNGLDPYTLHKFMGWRLAQTAFIYDRRGPEKVDEEVYSKHPFLGLWG